MRCVQCQLVMPIPFQVVVNIVFSVFVCVELQPVPTLSGASGHDNAVLDTPLDISLSSSANGTSTSVSPSPRSARLVSSLAASTSTFWQRFDNNIMKPVFGGNMTVSSEFSMRVVKVLTFR